MAITDAIDLTLESMFAGEDDPLLLPIKHRSYLKVDTSYHNLFLEILDFIPKAVRQNFELQEWFGLPSMFCNLSEDFINLYTNLYDKLPAGNNNHSDPYFAYHFCSGENCDRCGLDLNLFTKGYYRTLCTECEKTEDEIEPFKF